MHQSKQRHDCFRNGGGARVGGGGAAAAALCLAEEMKKFRKPDTWIIFICSLKMYKTNQEKEEKKTKIYCYKWHK